MRLVVRINNVEGSGCTAALLDARAYMAEFTLTGVICVCALRTVLMQIVYIFMPACSRAKRFPRTVNGSRAKNARKNPPALPVRTPITTINLIYLFII